MRRILIILIAVGLTVGSASNPEARTANIDRGSQASTSLASPAYCNVAHNVGNIALGISNDGTFGTSFSVSGFWYDCFTGESLPQCEYPQGDGTSYLYGAALWMGAIVGSDTLVSTGTDGWSISGNEFHPDETPFGNMIYRSTLDPASPAFIDAVSEQDYVAVYRDTCLDCPGVSRDQVDGRHHRPLNVEVTQKTYAWSYPHADDFVLFDYSIRNIGTERLRQFYLGVFVDADIHDQNDFGIGAQDDLSGFWKYQSPVYQSPLCPDDSLELNLAWSIDNDGDLGQVVMEPVPHITATGILRTPSDSLQVSYNWWVSNQSPSLDFGPMRRVNYRDFGTGGTGTPLGDRNKYFLLSNGDVDYDQYRVATIGSEDPVWLPPPVDRAPYLARGMDTRYLLSFGPFDIEPGESLPLTLAYIGGQNVHTEVANFSNLPNDPDAYRAGLDFSDLAANAAMAAWVFDNPGVDTDSDGYAGEYMICDPGGANEDTVWTKGDGVPDLRPSVPPPPPTVWAEPFETAIRVRWNGFAAETSRDPMSRQVDFEGYNAYLSISGVPSSFTNLGSYDIEDFYIYYWDAHWVTWKRHPYPLTLEAARCAYAASGCADPTWYPLDYTRQAPLVVTAFPDSILYFEPVMANAHVFGLETPFVKRFPAATKPGYADPNDVPLDSTTYFLTADGYFKYYEYEVLLDELLPGHKYWVGITAFDYGSPETLSFPLETHVSKVAIEVTTLGGPSCCIVRVGDANGLGGDEPTMGDVALLIDALFISNDIGLLPCLAEADINQSGGAEPTATDVTIGDISILINYLFITGPSLGLPDCL